MRYNAKKLMSLFLALCLMLTFAPAAFAEGGNIWGTPPSTQIVVVEDTGDTPAEDAAADDALIDADDGAVTPNGHILRERINYGTPIERLPSFESITGMDAASLPASYDLRDQNKVTSVKNQNPYGTCWAHSAVASAESHLMYEDWSTSTDFSELQLAYFGYNKVTDTLGNTAGDTVTLVGDSFLDHGGDDYTATFTLSSWLGLVNETDMPYDDASKYANSAMDSKYARSYDAAHLDNAYFVDCNSMDYIKQMIMAHGAGSIGYYHSESYYNSSTYAYYCSSSNYPNHAVTVVGWDDSFSKTNFKSTNRPSYDGAWLIKNSWGPDWGDNGYFWVSYYDKSITYEGEPVVFYDFDNTTTYSNIYQYDGGIASSYIGVGGSVTAANIFTAAASENLTAVSYMTYSTDYTYTINVYNNVTAGDPDSGTLAATQTGSETYAGYHSVKLDTPVALTNGQKFSVVVTITKTSGTPHIGLDVTQNYSNIQMTSTVLAGQSFYKASGSMWLDMAANSGGKGNFRIKAFTGGSTAVAPSSITSSKTSSTVGEMITWTGAHTGGTGTVQYMFRVFNSDGVQQNTAAWQTGTTYAFTPESAGTYYCTLQVKDTLTTPTTVVTSGNVTVTAGSISPTGITADKSSASVGDTITWTGTYTGGTGTDTKFLFRVYDSSGVQQNATTWQTGTTYAFTPTKSGTYYCTFKAKDSATTSSNMLTSTNVTVSAQTTTIRTTGITADKSSASVGDTITWTGTYTGGTGTDTKFLFRVYDSNGVQRNATAWQTGTTYAFTPTSAGTYYCTFKAKDSATTSSNMLTSTNVTVSAQTTVLRTTGITADKSSASVGDTITWTGTYAGGTGTSTKFLFRVYDSNGVQRNATAWQTGTTYSFTPTKSGTYYCTFKAKDSATSSSNMLTSTNVTVSAQTTVLRTTGITADKSSANVGDTITWTGTYAGGTGTSTKFLFRVYDSNGVQRNATAWQTGTTYSFMPTKSGTYYCTFKAKDSATSSSNMLTSTNVTVSAQTTTIRTTGITADKSSANVGDTITWTGTYAGGTGTSTKFLFRVYDSNGVQRNATAWQTGTTYSFMPTKSGTYYCTFKAKDSATSSSNMLTSTNVTVSAQTTVLRTTGITADKSSASVGDTITWTGTYAGGTGTSTKFLFRVYDSNGVQRNATAWQTGTTYAFTPTSAGTYYCTFKAKDSATSSSNMLTSGNVTVAL